jgi:hypothetical protein
MKKRNLHTFLFVVLNLLLLHAKAQIINEGFEEAIWTTPTQSSSGTVIITATSASSTNTYFTSNNNSSGSTGLNTSPNSGTWWYSKGMTSSDSRLNKAHSATTSWNIGGSSGYLITPVITGGISSVTFWLADPGNFFVGLNSNTTVITQPTGYSSNSSTNGYTFLAQSFASGGSSGGTSGQQFIYTGTFSGPCRLGFFNLSSSSLYLDDIVITAASSTPVAFTNIGLSKLNNSVSVSWGIATEINANNYFVEKSTDAINFSSIGTVAAKNLGKYSFTDASPASGTNYYRIKEVDFSGEYQYSKIATINLTETHTSLNIVDNPVTNGRLVLQMNNYTQGSYTINIFTAAGQKVLSTSLNHPGGSLTQTLQMPMLNKGIYFVQTVGNNLNLNKQILVE